MDACRAEKALQRVIVLLSKMPVGAIKRIESHFWPRYG